MNGWMNELTDRWVSDAHKDDAMRPASYVSYATAYIPSASTTLGADMGCSYSCLYYNLSLLLVLVPPTLVS
jgi:hypothetical protein